MRKSVTSIGTRPRDEHVLIVPGAKTKAESKWTLACLHDSFSSLSRTAQYRALLNLRAVEEILERERPDVIESADPYQLGWKALKVGRALRVPVVGFYHSHFPEAYVRKSATLLGKTATRRVMKLSRAYVRKLYNQHAATVVASERLGRVLRDWGVHNVRVLSLGVNTEIFRPDGSGTEAIRRSLGSQFRSKTAPLRRPAGEREEHSDFVSRFQELCNDAGRMNFICS